MNKIEKGLQVIMWIAVISLILIGILSIMVGHATDYRFLFGTLDLSNLVLSAFNNVKIM